LYRAQSLSITESDLRNTLHGINQTINIDITDEVGSAAQAALFDLPELSTMMEMNTGDDLQH